MTLSYLRADARKQMVTHIRESWRFESMYTMQGKPDQHATRIPRSVLIWSQTIRISRGQRIATLYELSIGLDSCTAPEKKCSRLHLSARLSGPWDPPQFLSQHNHWSSALKPSTCWQPTTRLTGPIKTSIWSVRSILACGGQPISS
jgi:hypothetical protein